MHPETIDEVLSRLDGIIEQARYRGSADGYFAALYRKVTAEVKSRIQRGAFQDGPRMARFDVVFAGRYVEAWEAHERGDKPSEVWGVAFGCGQHYWPVVLQHLLVGMNAHINLDLGIAAAEVSPGRAIEELAGDFNLINDILCEMVDTVQERLAAVWPAVKVFDRICGELDEAVIHFSIRRAREQAWSLAQILAAATPAERAAHVERVDRAAAALGRRILNPGVKLSLLLATVRLRERGHMIEKMDVLLA